MTSDYTGVQTHNAFDLLDDDAPAKQTKPKEEPKKEPTKRTSDRDRPTPRVEGGDRRVDGGSARGRGGRGRGGRGGASRGGEGGGEGYRERKEFDRHISRDGKSREPKRDGAGKFNEGSVHDIIADAEERRSRAPRRARKPAEEEEAPAGSKADTDAAAADVPTEEPAAEASAEDKPVTIHEPEEKEPPTRTYDEFLNSKQKLDADLAIQRRAVQNDESQFKAVKAIAKSEEKNPYVTLTAEEKEKTPKAKKDKAKHISFDEFILAANNGNPRGGIRGRGGRGGGGGRGRGDARSLRVDDQNFPSLEKDKK